MINIKDLTESDIGKWVVYNKGKFSEESGRIKSWNGIYIFVVYKCTGDRCRFKKFTAVATSPKQLTFKES